MFNSSKKGYLIGTVNSLITASIVVVAVLIISYLLVVSLGTSASEETEEASLQGQTIISLQAYLRTPVMVDINGEMQSMEMSDLIRLAKINANYVPILEKGTRDIFDTVYPGRYKIKTSGIFTYDSGSLTDSISSYKVSEKIALPGEISVTLSLK